MDSTATENISTPREIYRTTSKNRPTAIKNNSTATGNNPTPTEINSMTAKTFPTTRKNIFKARKSLTNANSPLSHDETVGCRYLKMLFSYSLRCQMCITLRRMAMMLSTDTIKNNMTPKAMAGNMVPSSMSGKSVSMKSI